MDEMDTSSSTSSASEKLSEAEDTPTLKGDAPEPMVGSPPLFTPIPSTSTMIPPPQSCMESTDVWMSPKKDAMEGVPTDLSALDSLPGTPSSNFPERVTQATDWFDDFKEEEQTWFVRMLLSRMHHHQHGKDTFGFTWIPRSLNGSEGFEFRFSSVLFSLRPVSA